MLCAPFGHDYLVTYRAYRKLATCLAQAGFPVCFFDYAGSGDSADTEAPAVQAWTQSISLAIKALQEKSGVMQVALFGVRLGALLAASVATQHHVAALALVAPVVSGKSYVRELLALARMSPIPASPDPERAVKDDEITGYLFAKTTQSDLSTMDLVQLVPALSLPIFVGERDDIAGQERKLLAALSNHDVTVATQRGYAAMMSSDAHNSEVPTALWDEIVHWLSTRFERQTLNATALESTPNAQQIAQIPANGCVLDEELLCFEGLTGVLTRANDQVPARPLTVVLSNTGGNHRVGNHRLYVNLARALAGQGFHVLRFDRGGMGYSRPTPLGEENEVYAASGVADMGLAMDYLSYNMASTGFILAGLCSAGYFAYHAAVKDVRVKSLIMINPLTFQWHPGDSLDQKINESIHSTSFYANKFWQLKTWKRVFQGDIALGRIGKKLTERFVQQLQEKFQIGKITEVRRNFLHLENRGVQLMLVFSENDSAIDVVHGELGVNAHALKNRTALCIETVPYTDHTFTPCWSQKYLAEKIIFRLNHALT